MASHAARSAVEAMSNAHPGIFLRMVGFFISVESLQK